MIIRPITWNSQTPALVLLDQRALPFETRYVTCTTYEQVADAITEMVVRGAPALSIAGAYGLVLAALSGRDLDEAYATLLAARPTASNLRWALDRLRTRSPSGWEEEASMIYREDIIVNQSIGTNLAAHIAEGMDEEDPMLNVYHHCNTGALATAGYGTALGAVRSLHEAGDLNLCWVGETRPYLQGARLTAWELAQENIPHMLVVDSAAGHLMSTGEVDLVVVGCDRVARDGGAANKIGTYALAVLAAANRIPFYVCCPWSTYDPSVGRGWDIPIEERSEAEVRGWGGAQWAEDRTEVYNPAFDVTPPELITGWVTEDGVYDDPQELFLAWDAEERP